MDDTRRKFAEQKEFVLVTIMLLFTKLFRFNQVVRHTGIFWGVSCVQISSYVMI